MNDMEKEFVPYPESLALKELGFDEPCFMEIWWLNDVHYETRIPFTPTININGNDINFKYLISENHPLSKGHVLNLQIPTLSQAFRFFREKYSKESYVRKLHTYYYHINDTEAFDGDFKTYEEAELECLRKLIQLCKKK